MRLSTSPNMPKATSPITTRLRLAQSGSRDTDEPIKKVRPRRIRWVAKPSRAEARTLEGVLPLSTRAISCLLQCVPNGQGGSKEDLLAQMLSFGGRPSSVKLLRIASKHTRAELLALRGVGVGTVDEIEKWLEANGHQLKSRPDSVTDALGRAIEHLAALLETQSEQDYLRALVALPTLKQALRAPPGDRISQRAVD